MMTVGKARRTLAFIASDIEAAEKGLQAAEAMARKGEEDVEDAAYAAKVRTLKAMTPKLMGKKSKVLRMFGIDKPIKPNMRVEGLIDAVLQVMRG